MRVRDCMSSPVQVIGPDAPAWEAAGLMRRYRFRRLPVVDGRRLVGIVTESDIFDVFAEVLGTGPHEVRLQLALDVQLQRGLANSAEG